MRLLVLLLLLNPTIAHADEPYAAEIAATKAKIERRLKDPSSVQYRDVRAFVVGGRVAVCGEVNAKNSYGGYTGFEGFADWNGTLTLPGGGSAIVTPYERQFVKLQCDGKPGPAAAPNAEAPGQTPPVQPAGS